jgi:hypothetical protein
MAEFVFSDDTFFLRKGLLRVISYLITAYLQLSEGNNETFLFATPNVWYSGEPMQKF